MEAILESCGEPRVEEVGSYIEEVAMLIPVYVPDGGDMTKIVLRSGERWYDPRPVPAVLKGIARYFGVDLAALRERYGEILGKRLNVPLPLSPHLVLTPLKMRQPCVPKDGTTGYVTTQWVERVVPNSDRSGCRIVCGDVAADCLQSAEFAMQQMRHARIVHAFYKQRMKLTV
jgi:hypothetical protein